MVLNQLSPAPCNSFVKVFASRQEEQETAFRRFNQFDNLESQVQTFLRGLRRIVRIEEENPVTITITPEYVMRLGEDMKRIVLETSTPEELTARLTPEELTARLKPEERLAGLKLEELPAVIEAAERLAGLKPKEKIVGLAANNPLSDLSFEEIEAYLEEHWPKSEADNGKPA